HEAGDDDLAPAVENPRRGGMPPDDLISRAHIRDTRPFHVDGAGAEDAALGIQRDDRRVADQEAHGWLFDLRRGAPGHGGTPSRGREARTRRRKRSGATGLADPMSD